MNEPFHADESGGASDENGHQRVGSPKNRTSLCRAVRDAGGVDDNAGARQCLRKSLDHIAVHVPWNTLNLARTYVRPAKSRRREDTDVAVGSRHTMGDGTTDESRSADNRNSRCITTMR